MGKAEWRFGSCVRHRCGYRRLEETLTARTRSAPPSGLLASPRYPSRTAARVPGTRRTDLPTGFRAERPSVLPVSLGVERCASSTLRPALQMRRPVRRTRRSSSASAPRVYDTRVMCLHAPPVCNPEHGQRGSRTSTAKPGTYLQTQRTAPSPPSPQPTRTVLLSAIPSRARLTRTGVTASSSDDFARPLVQPDPHFGPIRSTRQAAHPQSLPDRAQSRVALDRVYCTSAFELHTVHTYGSTTRVPRADPPTCCSPTAPRRSISPLATRMDVWRALEASCVPLRDKAVGVKPRDRPHSGAG
ncbi:hypothetical protein C8Q80DRAFT_585954 [Daedaleopsis nitida]|nr:hypothetical protein C8Q80DRAFT_585954 [Daedaleopsis nitida]